MAKKRQKSKAAAATEAARAAREAEAAARRPARDEGPGAGVEKVEFKGGGGMLTRMRGGFQSMAGQGEAAPKKGGWLNTAIWIGIGIAAALLIGSSFR